MQPDLNNLLALSDKKILFVGIGNVLKKDDGVGVFISRGITNTNNILSLTVEVSIENYIGKINSINPDILVLIDCVDMGLEPGSFALFPIDQIQDLTFNTHNISLSRLSEFFTMTIFILGIQPLDIDFGEKLSYIVSDAVNNILQLINKKEANHG